MAEAVSAVVTGAAMGMGKAISAKLVADGVVVAGLDRDQAALEEAAAELGDAFVPVAGDVGDWAAHERAADAAEARAPLRHWVNNAGIDIASPAHEATQQHIDDGLRVLLMGVMYGSAVAARRMVPGRQGSIVNISSIQGVAAWPRYFVYDAAKAGILGATRNLALDYAPYGIRVNAVCPTSVRDDPALASGMLAGVADMLGVDAEDYEALSLPHHPLGTLVEARDVAAAVLWLASEAAARVTGAAIPVDAGFTAR